MQKILNKRHEDKNPPAHVSSRYQGFQKYRRLIVWNKSMDFIGLIYKLTSQFPNNELYGLTSQLRRASVSISLNIVEGSGAGSDMEYKRFLNIARRSAYEVLCGLEIAQKLNFCTIEETDQLSDKCDQISAMITGLSKKIGSKLQLKTES